jgi:glycosyltransferase involved in cell wall biosynthesis
MERQGHEAPIACTYLDKTGMPDQVNKVQHLLPPPWLSSLVSQNRLAFLILGPWILLALTWKYSRDVDILNPHNFPSSWIAVLVGVFRKIPIVWTCNEPPERLSLREAFNVGVRDYLGWLVASSWLDKVFITKVDAIHVPSEKTRQQVMDRYRRDAVVINLGIDVGFFEDNDKSQLPWKLDLGDKFVLLTVGKLHPQKNQILCLEALNKISIQIPNAILLLAGDGPSRQFLEKQAKILGVRNQVFFLGHCTSLLIRKLYQISDVNLFPPVNQSWGFTPFEALCADKISIVSNDCGASEILAKQNIGLVCEPTAEAFAKLIVEVHNRPEFCTATAKKGHGYVSQYLNWKVYSQKVLEVMEGVSSSSQESKMNCEIKKEAAS